MSAATHADGVCRRLQASATAVRFIEGMIVMHATGFDDEKTTETAGRGTRGRRTGRRIAAGAVTLAAAAALGSPAIAGADTGSAGPMASIAGMLPAGSAASLMDIGAYALNGISAPDVTVKATNNKTKLGVEQKNTNPLATGPDDDLINCTTVIFEADEAPESIIDLLESVAANPGTLPGAPVAFTMNISGDEVDGDALNAVDFETEFGDGTAGSADGDYRVSSFCGVEAPAEFSDWFGIDNIGFGGVGVNLYQNADVVLKDGEFSVDTDVGGGSGSLGSGFIGS